eukprot:scaffold64973_cov61-Phaeocystis_antarctica.AAC.2
MRLNAPVAANLPASESHRASGMKAVDRPSEIESVSIMAVSDARRPSRGESMARAHAHVAKTSVPADNMKSRARSRRALPQPRCTFAPAARVAAEARPAGDVARSARPRRLPRWRWRAVGSPVAARAAASAPRRPRWRRRWKRWRCPRLPQVQATAAVRRTVRAATTKPAASSARSRSQLQRRRPGPAAPHPSRCESAARARSGRDPTSICRPAALKRFRRGPPQRRGRSSKPPR